MLSEKKGTDTEEWELGEAIWNIYILADQKLKQEAEKREGESKRRGQRENDGQQMGEREQNLQTGGCSQRKLP